MKLRVRLFKLRMLIPTILSLPILWFAYHMSILARTNLQNTIIYLYSSFVYIIGFLLLFISILLFLDRVFLLLNRWLLYKFGTCIVTEVNSIYKNGYLSNKYYLTCEYCHKNILYIVDSDFDKSGYLKKSPPETVNIYISKLNPENYFIDLPITI